MKNRGVDEIPLFFFGWFAFEGEAKKGCLNFVYKKINATMPDEVETRNVQYEF